MKVKGISKDQKKLCKKLLRGKDMKGSELVTIFIVAQSLKKRKKKLWKIFEEIMLGIL